MTSLTNKKVCLIYENVLIRLFLIYKGLDILFLIAITLVLQIIIVRPTYINNKL